MYRSRKLWSNSRVGDLNLHVHIQYSQARPIIYNEKINEVMLIPVSPHLACLPQARPIIVRTSVLVLYIGKVMHNYVDH